MTEKTDPLHDMLQASVHEREGLPIELLQQIEVLQMDILKSLPQALLIGVQRTLDEFFAKHYDEIEAAFAKTLGEYNTDPGRLQHFATSSCRQIVVNALSTALINHARRSTGNVDHVWVGGIMLIMSNMMKAIASEVYQTEARQNAIAQRFGVDEMVKGIFNDGEDDDQTDDTSGPATEH